MKVRRAVVSVRSAHCAEIERHLLEAGRRQLAQASRHLGNPRQIDLAFGAYADSLRLEYEFAAERLMKLRSSWLSEPCLSMANGSPTERMAAKSLQTA
jgi:hypothetical protein